MKLPIAALVVLALSWFAAPCLAHGGGEHIMGTVATVEAKSLTVETTEKKRVTVTIDDGTKFEKSGVAAKVSDLSPGERVVMHTAKPDKSGQLKAVLVKFGQPPKGGSDGAHDHHHEHEHGEHDPHGTAGKK